MELLSTTKATLPYVRRLSNFNRAYFQHQASLCTTHVQPLKQKLPVLKSEGLRSPPTLLRGTSIVCKSSTEELTWAEAQLPEFIIPYFRLGRLECFDGIWFHAWPAYWSIMLTTNPGMLPDFKLMGLYFLISILKHISCCTSNDIFDMDLDKQVERCKTRPLASGAITPVQGWLFWALNIALLVPLVLQFNKICLAISVVEQVLALGYPFMKRVTYWPQAYLGVAHNLGVFVGWAAVNGNLNDIHIFLPAYLACICWSLVYDTLYAQQDKEDDRIAGIKSTAVLFGDENSTKNWLLGFASTSVGLLTFTGYNAHMGWPFFLGMSAAFGHLLWQIFTVDYSNGLDCLHKFESNKWYGALVFAGMLMGRLVY